MYLFPGVSNTPLIVEVILGEIDCSVHNQLFESSLNIKVYPLLSIAACHVNMGWISVITLHYMVWTP